MNPGAHAAAADEQLAGVAAVADPALDAMPAAAAPGGNIPVFGVAAGAGGRGAGGGRGGGRGAGGGRGRGVGRGQDEQAAAAPANGDAADDEEDNSGDNIEEASERLSWHLEPDPSFSFVASAHRHSFDRHTDARALPTWRWPGGVLDELRRPSHFRVLVLENEMGHLVSVARSHRTLGAFREHAVPQFVAFVRAQFIANPRVAKFKVGMLCLQRGQSVATAGMNRVRTGSFYAAPRGIEGATRGMTTTGYLHQYDRMMVVTQQLPPGNGAYLEVALIELCQTECPGKCDNLRSGGDGQRNPPEGETHRDTAVYVVWRETPDEEVPAAAAAATEGG